MPPDRISLGKAGEDYACRELERQGYEILARRFRTRLGEIDIVARDGDTLVFIEVKARRTHPLRRAGRGGRLAEAADHRPHRRRVRAPPQHRQRLLPLRRGLGRLRRRPAAAPRDRAGRLRRSRPLSGRRLQGVPAARVAVRRLASLATPVLRLRFVARASGNNSVVECDLAKVEVAGSNPVSRSIFSLQKRRPPIAATQHSQRRRSQVVRQRSAKPPSPVQIRAAPPILNLVDAVTCGLRLVEPSRRLREHSISPNNRSSTASTALRCDASTTCV